MLGPYRKQDRKRNRKKTKDGHYLRLTIVIHHVSKYCYVYRVLP